MAEKGCYEINFTAIGDTELEKLENIGVNKEEIFKKNIDTFGFYDDAYKRYCGYYLSVCKAIAAQAYYHFLTARTYKDAIPIKELCEKFGEVTYEEITYYTAKQQGLDLSK